MRTIETILATLVCATVALATGETSTITLRSTILAPAGQELTLGDIAHLTGNEAERLAETPIGTSALRPDPAGWRKIDAQAVRTALEAAQPMWGAIQLRGGPAYVRTITETPTTDAIDHPERSLDVQATPGTVRQLAEHHIARRFKVTPQDIEVRWVEASEGLLDHPTAGLLPHLDDAGRSDRMWLTITLYDEQANPVIAGQARATVRIRRDVAVLTRDVPRRRIVSAGDIRTERQWTDATDTPADPASGIGREAAIALKASSMVRETDVHSSIAVKRGDRVQIRIITPTIPASLLARALKDGRVGETIEFESVAPSRRDRLRFDARIESAGSAVAIAGAPTR